MLSAAFALLSFVLVLAIVTGLFILLSRALMNGVGQGPTQPGSGPCVRHEQRTSPMPPAHVHEAVQRGLLAVGAKIVWVEPWRMCAVRGMNWKSGGCILTVWLYPHGDATGLMIESKPLLPTVLFDFGQGSANVRGVLASLEAERVVAPHPA